MTAHFCIVCGNPVYHCTCPYGAVVAYNEPPPVYDLCRACDQPLCAELDAYYGKDPALLYLCSPCRELRMKVYKEKYHAR